MKTHNSIEGNFWNIIVEYYDGKHPVIEVKPQRLILKIPSRDRDRFDILEILEKHKDWIIEKYSIIRDALKELTSLEFVDRSYEEFKELVNRLVEEVSEKLLGLNVFRVRYRRMKTRWASLSPRGILTINTLAMKLPEYLIKYIVFHEVCHIFSRRHDDRFKRCITKYYPNYEELEKKLFLYEIKMIETNTW